MMSSNHVHRFLVKPKVKNDPRSNGYLADAHALGIHRVQKIDCCDLYFIQGNMDDSQVRQLANQLLHDP